MFTFPFPVRFRRLCRLCVLALGSPVVVLTVEAENQLSGLLCALFSMGVIGCVVSLYSWQLMVPLVSASTRLRRICVRCHVVKRLCLLHGLYSVTRENPRAEHSGFCCDVIYTLGVRSRIAVSLRPVCCAVPFMLARAT